MKTRRAGIGALVAAAFVVVLGPGCNRVSTVGDSTVAKGAPPALPVVPHDAAPLEASSPADAATEDAEADAGEDPSTLSSWSDPVVLDHLARDCSWRVPYSHANQAPISCMFDLPEQSCSHADCGSESYSCTNACYDSCGTCVTTCVGSCGSCEATCTDDACRKACAVATSTCRAACTTAKDRCATAGCAAREKACTDAHDARWNAHKCWERCDKERPCIGACPDWSEADQGAAYRSCAARCTARYKGGCPADFEEFCEHPS